MKSRFLPTVLFLFLAIASLSIPSNHVSAQTSGCDPVFAPIVYNQGPISATIDGQFWSYSYCFNGNAGDIITIAMDATSGDLDTYLELQDSNRIKLTENDDIDKDSKNSLIQYTLPTTGAYYISAGRYGDDTGKTFGEFSLTLSSASGSNQQGRPTNTTSPTDVCNNVALNMDFVGSAFSAPTNLDQALLDDNPNTGWSSTVLEYDDQGLLSGEYWFDVVLNGTQTVTSIEFNSNSSSGNPANALNLFSLARWVIDTESFEYVFLSRTALQQSGYQTYVFDSPVTTDSLTFFLEGSYGGSIIEVSDIKVCTNASSPDNTAGRPTTNTTTQTQPIAPTVPCTIQAKSSQAKTAEARLGIGTGRSVAGFLETGKTYNVTGKNNDNDGNIWWSVDKYDVVSKVKGDNIKEDLLYIADAQTIASGDCDAVGEVSDSRIIRAPRPAPPTNPATSSGDNTSVGNTTAPPQPIPEEGSTDQFINFYADPGYIFEGECTTLHWYVTNVKAFYFIDSDGKESGAAGPAGSKEVCPQVPTGRVTLLTYALRVVPLSGEDIYQYAEVTVDANFIDVGACTPTFPFLSDGGTLDDRSQDSYSIFVKPCEAANIEIYVGKASGDMDPYLYVTDSNGNVYEDNDSGADFDALLNFCVFGEATIFIDVSNAYTDGTGEYYIQVTTNETFCG